MNRKPIFDAVRILLGRSFTKADIAALDTAITAAIAAPAVEPVGPQPIPGKRRTSERGIALIKNYESCKLKAYKDPGPTGLPITIGWGSTIDENGDPIKLGDVWTQERADARFKADLLRYELDVIKLLNGAPVTQGQFDALVSFAYNVGPDIDADTIPEGLGDSTLLKKHLAGDYAGAKLEFAKWNKSKGKVLSGLTKRRAAEAELYAS